MLFGFFSGSSATHAVIDILQGLGWDTADEWLSGIQMFLDPTGGSVAYEIGEKLIDDGALDTMKYYLYERVPEEATGETIQSTAEILQKTVSTWYVTLRAIALVGLLSVLVYIGIRILISSTGEKKAKYKKVLLDWLVAMCILFVLQYMMYAILEVTERITEIFSGYAVEPSGRDMLMSDIREEIFDGSKGNFLNIFSYVIIYLVLIVFTVIFTWKYLKRVIYIAFLTIIAPLIALTYPLDKIKDREAQALTMWIREYIFYALIQVVHLLLYCIFVGSSNGLLVANNPLFAVAAIAFLIPAEKFFKRMFGFDKTTAGNDLKAAAGGALIMNAINKIGQKTKSGKSDSTNRTTPRYASDSANTSIDNMDSLNKSNNSTARYASDSANASIDNMDSLNKLNNSTARYNLETKKFQNQTSSDLVKNTSGNIVLGEKINPAKYENRNFKNGAKTLSKHYLKKGAKGIGRGALGALGVATFGTLGLAAGISTGEADKVLQYGLTGGAAGYVEANNIGNKIAETGKQAKEIFDNAPFGEDENNARKLIQELSKDSSFNEVCRSLGVSDKKDKEEIIRQFYSNGISDPKDIKKAMDIRLKTGVSQPEIVAAQKIRQKINSNMISREEVENNLRARGITDQKYIDRAMNLIDKL